MSRIRIRTKSVVAAVVLSVMVVGAVAPSASAASKPKPQRAILKAIL